jgi:hypothetical protein
MSDMSGASIMGRWLVREEGWAKTRAYKARKKNNNTITATNHNSNITQQQATNDQNQQELGSYTRQFQQLNLHGDNIDEQDGEDFADTMTKKGPHTIRIISQNINAMPDDSRQVKTHMNRPAPRHKSTSLVHDVIF